MLQSPQIEELVCLITSMDRPALIGHFLRFKGSFPIDFTPEFLEQLSTERLQHIFLALCLQSQHVPQVAEMAA
jgi:hypothetical protein